MPRIVYFVPAPPVLSGGNKVTFRHVEALVGLGYEAVVRLLGTDAAPTWFAHDAPMERGGHLPRPDDILVYPEDAGGIMATWAGLPNRKVVFCQNPYTAAAHALTAYPPEVRAQYRTYMACSPGVASWIARYLDYDLISSVPAFADERLFVPAPKQRTIACIPRKRPLELKAIRHMFDRLYRGAEPWGWDLIEEASEVETAAAVGRASVFLSLARLEGMSMTIVEAMACDCLVTGFTGIGPREYATSINGLWVEEDNCEAAAHALVQAVTLADEAGGPAALMRHAARQTAAQWSHAAFVETLAAFWRDQMGVHPDRAAASVAG